MLIISTIFYSPYAILKEPENNNRGNKHQSSDSLKTVVGMSRVLEIQTILIVDHRALLKLSI